MTEKRCYYEVLGVEKGAASDDIRKAYRQAALKHHPDRNQGDPEAEQRFKEATEAFQILSDDQKRARYDRFGHAGVEGSMPDFGGDIFSHFQDIFSEFFGGARPGGGGRRRNGPARGADLRVQQRLTLQESFVGCKREVSLRTPVACEACEGSGAKAGTKRKTCGACGGAGQVSTARGFVMFTQTCPECGGEGSVVKTPCTECHGSGNVEKVRKVVVAFPAGIDGGQRLRVPGQGMPGTQGGPAGDLFVDVDIAPDPAFERDGQDLITRVKVSVAEATLGATREVELPDGSTVEVEVAAGTQPGEVVTTRGRGVPRIDGRGRGALHAVIQVEIPKQVPARARELLLELDAVLTGGAKRDAEKEADEAPPASAKIAL
ncbi:MAG: molecular chaperone DnaJ [Myxococcales bacterium]|nr:molecular chaperone DnaJ [Myxococcales bacterium]